MGKNPAMWTYASWGKKYQEDSWSSEIVLGKGSLWVSDFHLGLPQLAMYHGKMLASKNEEMLSKMYKVYYSLKISGRDI